MKKQNVKNCNIEYKKGTMFTVKSPVDVKSIGTKRDMNNIKTIVSYDDLRYLICLRKVDNQHCLCACVYDIEKPHSVKLAINNEILWVSFTKFIDVNIKYLNAEYINFPNQYEFVKDLYDLHNKKKEKDIAQRNKKSQSDKTGKKDKANAGETSIKIVRAVRYTVYIKQSRKNEKRIQEITEINKKLIEHRSFHHHKSSSSYYSSKYYKLRNVFHPVSAGRGNF